SGMRTAAIEVSSICNDIRLLVSGPRTGFGEISIPAVQPGSSIMPGKVNPAIPEMVNQVCFQVIGNDTAVAWGAQASQLELNVMMPGINYAVCFSATILANAVRVLREKTIDGLRVDEERAKELMDMSPLLIVVSVLVTVARLLRIPYPVLLLVGGLALGSIPAVPRIDLAPGVVLVLVLPPILYVAAFFTPIRSFKADIGNIASLAVGLVVASTAAVAGVALALVPSMTLPVAVALGAIVSPPDAVAATAVME